MTYWDKTTFTQLPSASMLEVLQQILSMQSISDIQTTNVVKQSYGKITSTL